FADPFKPKENLLPLSFKSIVYDKSILMVFSSITPIASFIKLTPNPNLLSPNGVLTEKALVVGAPSKPAHCVLCCPKMLKAPRLPAYAGLILMVLYIYCVNCASCCAVAEKLTKANKADMILIFFIALLF